MKLRAAKYVKQRLTELKGEREKSIFDIYNTNASQKCYAKWKKFIWKSYMLYDCIYMTVWKKIPN